jgi:hypothetical protein
VGKTSRWCCWRRFLIAVVFLSGIEAFDEEVTPELWAILVICDIPGSGH